LNKIDSTGDIQWSKTYSVGLNSGDQTTDGGYILAGDKSLIKTDENGVIQWEHNFEENGFLINFSAVQQSNDDGYILAGWRLPEGVNNDDFRPYFKALKDVKYDGRMAIECSWKNMEVQASDAIKVMRSQLASI